MILRLLPFLFVAFAFASCGDDSKKPSRPAAPVETKKPVTPLVPKVEIHDWCKEHGVPESICTRCDGSLTPGFKAKGDWCKEHDVPESQCFKCNPALEAKFKAKAPKGALVK